MRQSSAAAARNSPGRIATGRGQEGVVDLGQVLSTTETSRLLNLSQIHLRWGQAQEYAERPLFQNKVLNRSIIMKYTPRPGELFEYAERKIKSTKILLPLDRHDLSLGSFAGVIGQKDFSRIMSRHLLQNDDALRCGFGIVGPSQAGRKQNQNQEKTPPTQRDVHGKELRGKKQNRLES